MNRNAFTCLAILLAGTALGARAAERGRSSEPAGAGPPPEVKAAMEELWRRGFCLLSSVYKPAAKECAVPKDIGQTPVLVPQTVDRRGTIQCYAADGDALWAADDLSVYQVDASTGRLLRRFGRADGLPGCPVQSIAPAGGTVWLATRSGLARLEPATGRVTVVPEVRFSLGRLAAGPSGVWLVSDAGVWRLAPGRDSWQACPEFPGQKQLSEVVGRGFWSALWRERAAALLPSLFATEDGLCFICLNHLLRWDAAGGRWQEISREVWQAVPDGRTVWALTTAGVLRHDAAAGKTESFSAGQGLAAGRPVALATTADALYVISQPDYDEKAGRFVGGGLSRLDLAAGTWTVTETVDGTDVRFATALTADGDQVWATCMLYDGAIQLGAHPGMAHVKRWRPRTTGLGLVHLANGRWTLTKSGDLRRDRRWVLGQKGTLALDRIGPESADSLLCSGGRIWGVVRMVPEQYYAGYFISAGCLAAEAGGRWDGRWDFRTEELGLAGEQPELMLLSLSHGDEIVLAEGHPTVLGLERAGGRTWAVCQCGLHRFDAAEDRFTPVVAETFRFYWRLTAAAAAPDAVWFGGDGGTVSRLDRATGTLELVGVVPGRKVVAMTAEAGRVAVRTARGEAVLPLALRAAPKLPDADLAVFDGRAWSSGAPGVDPPAPAYSCKDKSSYLYRGGRPVAFLKGVFRPTVLCEDPVGGRLWIATHEGLASVPIPGEPGAPAKETPGG
jgi:hypothetical protein